MLQRALAASFETPLSRLLRMRAGKFPVELVVPTP